MKKDNLWVGLLVGGIAPIVGYYLIDGLIALIDVGLGNRDILIVVKPRTHYLLALAVNIIFVQWSNRAYRTRTIRGIVAATLIYAFLWLWYYYRAVM